MAMAAVRWFGGSRLGKGLGHHRGVLQCLFSAAVSNPRSLPSVTKLPAPWTASKWQPPKPRGCVAA